MIDRFRFWMIQNLLLMTSRDNERKFQFVKHVIQADSLKYYRIICYDIAWKNLLYARYIGLTLVIKLKKLSYDTFHQRITITHFHEHVGFCRHILCFHQTQMLKVGCNPHLQINDPDVHLELEYWNLEGTDCKKDFRWPSFGTNNLK